MRRNHSSITNSRNPIALLARTVVLVEDHRFYRHHGVSLIGLVRAFMVNMTERRYAQGGSTITQQLARTLWLSNKKTLWRKLKEIALAFYLEWKMPKDDILLCYMGHVYMGQDGRGKPVMGFDHAAFHYFKKPLAKLNLREQVSLVAMLKGPNVYGPGSNKGLARRTVILGMLLEAGEIPPSEFEKALDNST